MTHFIFPSPLQDLAEAGPNREESYLITPLESLQGSNEITPKHLSSSTSEESLHSQTHLFDFYCDNPHHFTFPGIQL